VKLDLHIVEINRIEFGDKTEVSDGKLSINRDELIALLTKDNRLENVAVELVHPGEKCRITRIYDVVEPRARIGDEAVDFPGALGRQGPVGEGTTCVLRGAAVIVSNAFAGSGGRIGSMSGSFVDTWGPAAEVTPYGKTNNIVLVPSPSQSTSSEDYQVAIKIAGLKTATYLAKAVIDVKPDSIENYESDILDSFDDLPRVAYIFQIFSNQFIPLPGDPVFYGDNVDGILPTIIHPNEIFDGAVTTRNIDTFLIQNHPVVTELYAEHGKNLNFVGVIITTAPNNGPTIDRISTLAANQAKYVLHADGVILTKYGGGAPEMTMGATAEKCERLGIKTTLAIQHAGLDTAEISPKPSTIFTDAEGVDAIISLGTYMGGPELQLSSPDRIIGVESERLAGELTREISQIKGATSLIGNAKLMTVRY
jgi:glycine reductase